MEETAEDLRSSEEGESKRSRVSSVDNSILFMDRNAAILNEEAERGRNAGGSNQRSTNDLVSGSLNQL